MMGFAPLPQQPLRLGPYWHRPVLATFTPEMDGAVEQILGPKLQSFRNPCAGVVKEGEKQPISLPRTGCGIRGGEHGVNLLSGHEPKERFGRFLLWYRENPLADADESDAGALPEHEAYKSSDGCQPQVARAGGVASGFFQVIEKSQGSGGTYRVKRQMVNRPAMML
jgi:hypothetical protein